MYRAAFSSAGRDCGLDLERKAAGWRSAFETTKLGTQVLLPTAQRIFEGATINDGHAEPLLRFRQQSCKMLMG